MRPMGSLWMKVVRRTTPTSHMNRLSLLSWHAQLLAGSTVEHECKHSVGSTGAAPGPASQISSYKSESVKFIFMVATLISICPNHFTKAMFGEVSYNLYIFTPSEKFSMLLLLCHSDHHEFDAICVNHFLETLFDFTETTISEGPFFSLVAQYVSCMHAHPPLPVTKFFNFSNTDWHLFSSHSVFLPWLISSTSKSSIPTYT